MGRGADLRLALSEQEAEQRLRAAAGERGSLHLRCHESSDGEEIGSLMRVFRQFLSRFLGSSHSPVPIGPGPPVLALCVALTMKAASANSEYRRPRGGVASGSPAEHSPPPGPTYALLPLRGIGTGRRCR